MAIRNLTAAEVIDQALLSAKRIAEGMGPVGHNELSAVVTSFRSALLSLASYDPANPPTVEKPDPEPVAEADQGPYPGETIVTQDEPAADPVVEPPAENLFG